MKRCMILYVTMIAAFIAMAGYTSPGIGHARSAAREPRAAAADTIEKRKVRNKSDETKESPFDKIIKTKEKTGGPDRKAEEPRREQVSEEKSSFWGSCLGDLLGSICSGMISSALEGDEEEPVPEVEWKEPTAAGNVVQEVPSESGAGAVNEISPDTLHYTATVMPLSADETVVLLWDKPGGEATQSVVLDTLVHASVIDTLEAGTEVSVEGISWTVDGFWVNIETMQEPKIRGWIREQEASPIEEPETRQ